MDLKEKDLFNAKKKKTQKKTTPLEQRGCAWIIQD